MPIENCKICDSNLGSVERPGLDLVLGLESPGLGFGLESPGLGLGLDLVSPGLGLGLGLAILALTTSLEFGREHH